MKQSNCYFSITSGKAPFPFLIQIYIILDKYGFQVKRAEQVEGVKRVMQINDYGKQSKMVKILVDKLFIVSISIKLYFIKNFS